MSENRCQRDENSENMNSAKAFKNKPGISLFFYVFWKGRCIDFCFFSDENSVNVRLASKAMKVNSDRAGSIRIDIRHFWSIAENYMKT